MKYSSPLFCYIWPSKYTVISQTFKLGFTQFATDIRLSRVTSYYSLYQTRRHADRRKKPLLLDTAKQRVPVVSDEFSRANMRSMLANNQYRYSTPYQDLLVLICDQDYIAARLGLYGHRLLLIWRLSVSDMYGSTSYTDPWIIQKGTVVCGYSGLGM